MNRPVMNPTFLVDPGGAPPPPRKKRWWHPLFAIFRIFRVAGRVLFYNPLARRRANRLQVDDGSSFFGRVFRGLLYRLAFVPILIAIAVAAFVYTGTHPHQPPPELDPTSQGIYYDAVSVTTEDAVHLDAWLVPMYDASIILNKREEILRKKHPAVLLVHDFGQNRQQTLPLVKPLHDAGFVVMSINLRGWNQSQLAGTTFGLREAMDVKAAIAHLRRLPYIDGSKIAIIGIGTGGSAAMITARDDASIAALVLDHPVTGANEIIDQYIGPHQPALKWMQPLCKWGFEMAYCVDADDLEMHRFDGVINSRPVLMLADPAGAGSVTMPTIITGVRDFLRKNVKVGQATASAR